MPKPNLVKSDHIKTQLNTFTFWEQIYALMPAKDPLRQKTVDAHDATVAIAQGLPYMDEKGNQISFYDEENSIEYVNGEGKTFNMSSMDLYEGDRVKHIPRQIHTDGQNLQTRLDKDIELLDQIEKKYSGKKGHEYLNTVVGIVKNKYMAAKEGIGYGAAPGTALYSDFDGIQKFTDVLLDIDGKGQYKVTDKYTVYKRKDPKIVEESLNKFGVTDIVKDFAEMEIHNKEWAKEWNKEVPDPQELRKIGDKFKKDMANADKHIKFFEKQFKEDAKKPDNEREIYNITNHHDVECGDVIYTEKHIAKNTRGINGEHWENHKKAFAKQYEKQLIAADLKYLKSRTPAEPGTEKLAEMVDDMIEGCTAPYYMDLWEVKKKNDKLKNMQEIAYLVDMHIIKLQELETEAAKFPESPFAKKVAETAKQHLIESPKYLKQLSDEENKAMEQKVAETELNLDPEHNMVEIYKNEMKQISDQQKPEGMSDDEFFAQQKQATIDELAKIIAAQTAERSIKSMKVAQQELADSGSGEAMTDAELQEEIESMLSEDYIKRVAEDIKTRDDFKKMTEGLTDMDSLKAIQQKAQNGNELLNVLHNAGKQTIAEEAQKEQMQQQLELEKQAPVKDAPVMQ